MSLRALLEIRLLPAILVAAIVIILPLFFPSAYYYRIGAMSVSAGLKLNGYELARTARNSVATGDIGRGNRHYLAAVFSVGVLLSDRRAYFHFCAGGCRPQPAHGLCRSSQPRSCRLSRDRCVFRRHRSSPFRRAFVAVSVRRRNTLGRGRFRGGPADSQAQRTLSRRRDARIRIARRHRAHQRGGLDGWSGWHERPRADAFRLARAWIGCLVLDRRRDICRRISTRAQSDGKPDRPRAASHP